jgi:hypothetical protein
MVDTPDQVLIHRPSHSEECQCELGAVAGQVIARRHLHDVPVLRLAVRAHRVDVLTCPACSITRSVVFPVGCRLLPTLDQEYHRWQSLCHRLTCCPWNAWARS